RTRYRQRAGDSWMDGRHALLLFGIRRNAGRLLPGKRNDKENWQQENWQQRKNLFKRGKAVCRSLAHLREGTAGSVALPGKLSIEHPPLLIAPHVIPRRRHGAIF
ncbi:MAG: hypothetical protein LBC37_02770, partial [Zoogloeaceae bacterium]|nr:hypothetical protein [Zoogloeaceae bacterium]